jgi:hypothetical protein
MARAGWDGVPGNVEAPVGSLMTGGGICVFFEDVSPSMKGVLNAPILHPGKGRESWWQGGKNVSTS